MRNVLPFIQRSEEWVFLIEGSGGEESPLPEVYFFTGVAKELNIPVVDPIVSPLGAEVTQRLISGPHPLLNLKDIHFAVFNNYFPDQASLHSLSEATRKRYISVIASYSMLSEDSIEILLTEYDTTLLNYPLKLATAHKVFARIRNDMIDTSNVLSREKLTRMLPEIAQARHIFICTGTYHLPVFANLGELFGSVYELHAVPEETTSVR